MSTTHQGAEAAELGQVVCFRVEGMDCGSCVAKVEAAASRLPGVRDVAANLMAETLTARLAPGGADAAALAGAVSALGYKVRALPSQAVDAGPRPDAPDQDHAGHAHGDDDDEPGVTWWRTGKARLAGLLAVLVGAAWALAHVFPAEAHWLYLAATLAAVLPFGRRALALARAGTPFSIETLMVTAALGAVTIGAAEEGGGRGAAVCGRRAAGGRGRRAGAGGHPRAGGPDAAHGAGGARRQSGRGGARGKPRRGRRGAGPAGGPPALRRPGAGRAVRGGRKPGHGRERARGARAGGEAVVAGSVNTTALLRVRVTAAAADNTVSRIVRMVEQATASRAPTQRFIERFSSYWTPGAMVVSALVILMPPLLFGGAWETWVYRGLAVLLIACPCALVISVPAAVASALSAGARRGLLVKGGAALEAVGKTRTVAFDKTGTLTQGKPRGTDVLPAEGTDNAGLLRAAAAVEAGSAHPLALAIVQAVEGRGIPIPPARAASAVPGKAAVANVDGVRVTVGSPAFAAERGADLGPLAASVRTLEEEGKTAVVVFSQARVLGVLAMRDEPREDAAAAISALKRMGVASVMLTGDNERTGRAIAGALGMDVRAHLLPDDKLREIEALKAYGLVMVGDGISV